jgi:endonuclease YncB( thermonuclease family)
VVLQTQKEKRDRYARYLAEVVHDGKNLSDYQLEIGAAKLWKCDAASFKRKSHKPDRPGYPSLNLRHEGEKHPKGEPAPCMP